MIRFKALCVDNKWHEGDWSSDLGAIFDLDERRYYITKGEPLQLIHGFWELQPIIIDGYKTRVEKGGFVMLDEEKFGVSESHISWLIQEGYQVIPG